MTELITITQTALQSQSWKMKAQGAAAMATVAKEQTGSLVAPHLGMVLSALLQGLSGRTWSGKVSREPPSGDAASVAFVLTPLLLVPGGAAEGRRISGVQVLVRARRTCPSKRAGLSCLWCLSSQPRAAEAFCRPAGGE